MRAIFPNLGDHVFPVSVESQAKLSLLRAPLADPRDYRSHVVSIGTRALPDQTSLLAWRRGQWKQRGLASVLAVRERL